MAAKESDGFLHCGGCMRFKKFARPVAYTAMACLLTVTMASKAYAEPLQPSDCAALDLKFSAFFKQPVGTRGLEVSEALRAADGRRVRMVGYMVAQEQGSIGRFLLTPRPVSMSEHADGDADDLPPTTVTVLLDASQRDQFVVHKGGVISVSGVLRLGRVEDGRARVSWVRLQLSPEALAGDRGGLPVESH